MAAQVFSKPPVPTRVDLPDFSAIDQKQKEIVELIDRLGGKLPIASNAVSTANNTKGAFNGMISKLKPLCEGANLGHERRLELRGCKYALLKAQGDFLSQIEEVYQRSIFMFDFGSGASLPSLRSARERIQALIIGEGRIEK